MTLGTKVVTMDYSETPPRDALDKVPDKTYDRNGPPNAPTTPAMTATERDKTIGTRTDFGSGNDRVIKTLVNTPGNSSRAIMAGPGTNTEVAPTP